jgi:hypothetical protein
MNKRYLFYWLSFIASYLFPFLYFFIKLGVTKTATTVVMPVIILGVIAVLKLCAAIPEWVSTWRPTVWKGVLKSIPVYLLFICLITFGLVFKHMIENQVAVAFGSYFEVVLVVFGGHVLGSILGAFHLKYKEEDLLAKGYTLGVVNHGK